MRHVLPAAVAAVAVAIAGGIAGCTAGSSPGSTAAPVTSSGPATAGTKLSWHACNNQGAQLRCASLKVPLDYAHPGGRKITLALSEVPATAPPSKRQGILLVNPGGPGGSGLNLASVRGRRPGPERRGRVRHRRLRHQGGRRFGAGDALRPVVLLPGQARLHPGQRRRRADPHQPGQGLRRGLQEEVRLAAAVHDHQGHRQGHGLDPGGHGAAEAQLLRATPTAPTSARCTPRCSRTGCTAWCWTAPSTRPASGTPTTSTRTTRSRAGSRRSSPGWPGTTTSITSGPPRSR